MEKVESETEDYTEGTRDGTEVTEIGRVSD
jgi:hypothetical protein